MRKSILFYSILGSLNALSCLLIAEETAPESAPKMPTNRYEKAVNPPADLRARDGWNVFVTGEALFWTARETGLEYVFKTKIEDVESFANTAIGSDTQQNFITKGSGVRPDFDWDWGFRVGLGYNIPHDSWDLHLLWTRINTTATDRSTGAPPVFDIDFVNDVLVFGGDSLTPTWGMINDLSEVLFINNDSTFPFVTKAKVKWKPRTNLLDLELGRKFFVAKWLTLRPHAGLRNAWIRQKYEVHYSGRNVEFRFTEDSITFSEQIKIKNNFWGIGPRAGLDTQWGLIKEFSIYGKAAISLLYGEFDIRQKDELDFVLVEVDEDDDVNRTFGSYFDEQGNSFWTTRAITDLALGLQWDHYFSSDRVHLGINLGWENHIFFGQNQMMKFFQNPIQLGSSSYTTNNGDLTLQGWVLGARLDF